MLHGEARRERRTTTASMRRLLLQNARLLRPSDASDSSPRTSTPSRTRCCPAAQNWTLRIRWTKQSQQELPGHVTRRELCVD